MQFNDFDVLCSEHAAKFMATFPEQPARKVFAAELTGIELVVQYEDRIAFELANPFGAGVVARAVPYCFIPSAVLSRIEDGQADLVTELGKLMVAARQVVR